MLPPTQVEKNPRTYQPRNLRDKVVPTVQNHPGLQFLPQPGRPSKAQNQHPMLRPAGGHLHRVEMVFQISPFLNGPPLRSPAIVPVPAKSFGILWPRPHYSSISSNHWVSPNTPLCPHHKPERSAPDFHLPEKAPPHGQPGFALSQKSRVVFWAEKVSSWPLHQ